MIGIGLPGGKMLNSIQCLIVHCRAFPLLKRSLIAAGVLILTAGCGSTSPYYQQKPSEVRARIKRVLFLPVFMGPQFFPNAMLGKTAGGYDKKYADTLARSVAAKLPDFDHVVKAVLKANEHYEFVEGTQQDLLSASPQIVRSEFFFQKGAEREMLWQHNMEYMISADTLAKLTEKYKADAVFYSYMQVKKVWTPVTTNRDVNYATGKATMTYKMIPSDTVVYLPVFVDKSGSTIYGGVRYGVGGKNPYVMNKNGDHLAYTSATKANEAQEYLPLPVEKVTSVFEGLSREKILEIVNRPCGSLLDSECGSLYGF